MTSNSSMSSISPSLNKSPSLCITEEPGLAKTQIIISNLSKDDFVADNTSIVSMKLSLVDRIKLHILNLATPPDVEYKGDEYYLNHIEYWSNLGFVNRVIIIFKTENAAIHAFNFLIGQNKIGIPEYVKISLQNNLLTRSKSFDSVINQSNSLSVTNELSNFKNLHSGTSVEYVEPEPKQFNALEDLSKLGIDISDFNNDKQLEELKSPPTLGRSKSLTKTLFKPELKINTEIGDASKFGSDNPQSPKITLDESN